MTWVEAVLIAVAGMAAGTINTVVGSGTLITFPALLAFGFPPVTANISNNIGLVPSAVSGAFGYRRELSGQKRRLKRLIPLSAVGAVTGAVLLLTLPAEAFVAIVPVLIGISLVFVIVQPWVQKRLAQRREQQQGPAQEHRVLTALGTYVAGIYGGYFGAAQGVLLVGMLGMLLPESLQRINALKIVLTGVVNAIAAIAFVALAFDQIDWRVVGLIAVGSTIGGFLGAAVGRRLPQVVLRIVIIVVGLLAIWRILTS